MEFSEYPTHALMEITARPDLVFLRGEGSWLWDNQGRRYLDFIQGWAVNCLGHCPPVIAQALAEQSRLLISPSPAFHNEPAMRLAARIAGQSGLQRVFLTSTGAEANEGAIKLARKWGSLHRDGAYEIITFHNAFHGRTLATMSASGKPQFEHLFEPKVPGFPKARLNDIDSVRALIGPRTVAVMLEPIQGEAGVVPASVPFLRELRELTRAQGLLLIVDEIQTGVGRTGLPFGFQHSAIAPDIMTLGKHLGGGVPLGALVASERVSCFEHGDQGGTYNGNPLMAAVGCAVWDVVMAPVFLAQVRARGERLRAGLLTLSRDCGLGQVRGEGLLLALDLGADIAGAVAEQARERGLLLNAPRADRLRLMPALTVSEDEIDQMLALTRQAIETVRSRR